MVVGIHRHSVDTMHASRHHMPSQSNASRHHSVTDVMPQGYHSPPKGSY